MHDNLKHGVMKGLGVLAVIAVAIAIGYRVAAHSELGTAGAKLEPAERARFKANEAAVLALKRDVQSLRREVAVAKLHVAAESGSTVADQPSTAIEAQNPGRANNQETALEVQKSYEELSRLTPTSRERYLEISQSMDSRRHQEPEDAAGFQTAHAALRAAGLPIRVDAANDGCSTSICSFTLDYVGRVEGLTDVVQDTVSFVEHRARELGHTSTAE